MSGCESPPTYSSIADACSIHEPQTNAKNMSEVKPQSRERCKLLESKSKAKGTIDKKIVSDKMTAVLAEQNTTMPAGCLRQNGQGEGRRVQQVRVRFSSLGYAV
jgi:hypothetical protein